jgi:L-threonylcarbamoyladenylate synthase
MSLVKANPTTVKQAATIIKKGGLVAFPTETVYGLGADAFNSMAVAQIYEVKKRPKFDPLIVHVSHIGLVEKICSLIPEKARLLMNRFWPGPLTLVLPKSEAVPYIVTAGLNTVAIRMPNHPVALQLIEEARTPIAAPSANIFGYISPTRAEHVQSQMGREIDLILDGGPCSIGIESTILKISHYETILLRAGGLPVEEIEDVIGPIKIQTTNQERPSSPGQLKQHYSPHTPLKVVNLENIVLSDREKAGLLAFKTPKTILPFEKIEVLSPQGDLREAASNLFLCLHRLDKANLDVIYAEALPEVGLGRAIMDRLLKASQKE